MTWHTFRRIVGTAVVLTVGAAAPVAYAETFTCTSVCDFGPEDTLDNLDVKNGGIATLVGTRVTGSIVVEDGGTLFLLNGVDVEGNVQSFGASEISVLDAVVGGSIQIKNTSLITVERSTVEADIQLEENVATAADTLIAFNTMGGNLQLFKNQFSGRAAMLLSNDVSGNLQLVDNEGGSIIANDNFVESAAQCSDNDSEITGSENDVGDLECVEIQVGGSSGGGGSSGSGGSSGGPSGDPSGGGADFEDDTCTGVCNFGPQDTLENLYVKNGGVATLDSTRVTGNIVAEDGGALFLLNGVDVEGNVQSFGASEISVLDAVVGGSIQIKNTPLITVERSTVEADIQLEENVATAADTLIAFNTMGGNLQLFKNQFSGRAAMLLSNEVSGNLQLVDNQGGSIQVNENNVESAAQCSDNNSDISGCGNDVGELECSSINPSPCAADDAEAADNVAGAPDQQSADDQPGDDVLASDALALPLGCGAGSAGALALIFISGLMFAGLRVASGQRR